MVIPNFGGHNVLPNIKDNKIAVMCEYQGKALFFFGSIRAVECPVALKWTGFRIFSAWLRSYTDVQCVYKTSVLGDTQKLDLEGKLEAVWVDLDYWAWPESIAHLN